MNKEKNEQFHNVVTILLAFISAELAVIIILLTKYLRDLGIL